MQETWIWSLVRELRFHMPGGQWRPHTTTREPAQLEKFTQCSQRWFKKKKLKIKCAKRASERNWPQAAQRVRGQAGVTGEQFHSRAGAQNHLSTGLFVCFLLFMEICHTVLFMFFFFFPDHRSQVSTWILISSILCTSILQPIQWKMTVLVTLSVKGTTDSLTEGVSASPRGLLSVCVGLCVCMCVYVW